MNKKRQVVWDKSKGHCWYCGCVLPEKGWHVDHLKPLFRGYDTHLQGCDTPENRVPSCAPCNLLKSVHTIEQFRVEIASQATRAKRTSVNVRTALRFKQIKITETPIVFWFETKGRDDG